MLYHDDKTVNKNWPLPHNENDLWDDVARLRETLNAIDKNIAAVEAEGIEFENRQDAIETRLDAIAGQTTEDTEILDARVDAEYKNHPNLGHNIRSIHSSLIKAADDLRGILVQINELARARIQGDINFSEAHERRKAEIKQEAITRLQQDDGLQSQINENARANLQNATTLEKLNENRKKDLRYEANLRIRDEQLFQQQLDDVSDAGIQNALNINQEAEQRREDIGFVHERIDVLDAENEDRIADIKSLNTRLREETNQSELEDSKLASELKEEIEVRTRQVETLYNLNERRKIDIQEEANKRIQSDEFIQGQVDTLAGAELQSTANLSRETEERRKNLFKVREQIDDLEKENDTRKTEISAEILNRREHDEQLQEALDAEKQARTVDIANLESNIKTEAREREAHDKALELDIHASLENELGLARQADENARANIQNAVSIAELNTKRKNDLRYETGQRITNDEIIKSGVIPLALAMGI